MMLNNRAYAEHRLLRELGGMTLTELRDRMPVSELTEHLDYWARLAAEAEVDGG
jgi:hypothetical protein